MKMKWYRPIPCDCTVDNPLICDTSNLSQYSLGTFGPHRIENHFLQGTQIVNWPDGVYFTTEDKECNGIPDDVLQNAFMIPIFSSRLVELLKSSGIQGFQFLPIEVFNYDNESMGSFYIANCTNMVDAFDYEHSRYTRFPDDWINPEARGTIICSKYVLRSEALEGLDVFRLEGQRRAYFVSERFVKVFRKHKLTGYSFLRVELT